MAENCRTTTVASKVTPTERFLIEAGASRRGDSISGFLREGAVALALREIDGYRSEESPTDRTGDASEGGSERE